VCQRARACARDLIAKASKAAKEGSAFARVPEDQQEAEEDAKSEEEGRRSRVFQRARTCAGG